MILMIITFLLLGGLVFRSAYIFLAGVVGIFTIVWPIQTIILISLTSFLYFKLKGKIS